ncbi:MAG: hypothetical protein ACI4JM_10640 [Oscillospiraceae bacterium]
MNDNIDSNKKDLDEDNNEDNHDIEPIASDQEKSDKEDDEKYEIKTGNEEIDELLNHLPEHEKKMIMKTSMSMLNMSASNHLENPITKKITEEHISSFLDASKQNMELDYKEKKQNKIFVGLIILAVMIFIVVLILLLKNTPELMEKIIYTFVGLITGIIGGYGVGKNKGDD